MRHMACIAIVFTAAFGTPQDAPPPRTTLRYTVMDLGTLPNCDVTYATAVNDSGSVVGYAYAFVPPGHGNSVLSRPFLWRNGKMTELPKLGGEHGQALCINAEGDIGGYADTKEYQDQPVIWQKAKAYTANAMSTENGRILSLLNDGTSAGDVFIDGHRRAGLWVGGKLIVLGSRGDVESVANAVNHSGTAVGLYIPQGGQGQSWMSSGDRHAALWKDGRQSALLEVGGGWASVSPVGRRLSECLAVNDGGLAVGWSDGPDGRRAYMWKDGKNEVLSTPKGYTSEAHSINKAGDIVGQVLEQANKPGWKWLACIWRGGKMEDLNQLIPSDSGWNLNVPSHITDNGLIVGYGRLEKYPDHRWRAFLLTPIMR